MKKWFLCIGLSLFIGAFVGCKREDTVTPPDPYDDIWQTDANGNTIKPDSSDWTSGDIGSLHVFWGNPHYPHPNPADSAIKIGYAISTRCYVNMWITEKGDTSTTIVLTDQYKGPGGYSLGWDLTDSTGNKLTNGLYTCHLTVEDSLNKYEGKGEILIIE